ncbi:MAG: hypothetical protein Q9M89_03725 [Persephonella sp.]|nr:hypothetical protein [Persephonella sp.]
MKVENNGMNIYKSILEMQKQMVDMLIQKNLQTDQSQQVNQSNNSPQENVVKGNKVSIYA